MTEIPTTLPAEYWHKRWHEARADLDRAVEARVFIEAAWREGERGGWAERYLEIRGLVEQALAALPDPERERNN